MIQHRKSQTSPPKRRDVGLTLLELLAVAVILGILATIAQNVYIGQVQRAKIAATETLLHELETAIVRYEIDTGEFPPTGSQEIVLVAGDPQTSGSFVDREYGSGLLHLTLVHSITGNATDAPPTWQGPYITFQTDQLTTGPMGQIEILDAFDTPVIYVRNDEYTTSTVGTQPFGTQMFGDLEPSGNVPPEVADDADPDLPIPNPFLEELWYNVSTFQLVSLGSNGTSFGLGVNAEPTSGSEDILIFVGTEEDDINNFGY